MFEFVKSSINLGFDSKSKEDELLYYFLNIKGIKPDPELEKLGFSPIILDSK